jgi:hypothetical protein
MNNEVINRENKNIYTNTKTLKDVSQYQEILKYMSLPFLGFFRLFGYFFSIFASPVQLFTVKYILMTY